MDADPEAGRSLGGLGRQRSRTGCVCPEPQRGKGGAQDPSGPELESRCDSISEQRLLSPAGILAPDSEPLCTSTLF